MEKRLALKGGFELLGQLGVYFAPVGDIGLNSEFKQMAMWEKIRGVKFGTYSIWIRGDIWGPGIGRLNHLLLEISFSEGFGQCVASINPNWGADEWKNIWTKEFRKLLCAFLQDFISNHVGKVDGKKLNALHVLIDKIKEESLIQEVAGKIKNLTTEDLGYKPEVKKLIYQLALLLKA